VSINIKEHEVGFGGNAKKKHNSSFDKKSEKENFQKKSSMLPRKKLSQGKNKGA